MHLAGTYKATARPIRQGGAAFGLLLLLAGCSAPDIGFVESAWSPFAGPRDIVTSDALTVQRVRGQAPTVAPLLPEPGNVWPTPEAPRPTLLGSPEEAFRNIPEYRPQLIEGAPPARSPVPTPAPGARVGSGAALTAPPALREPQRFQVNPPLAAPTAPPRPAEGQVLIDPQGRPAVVTGEAGRVRGVQQPGIGGGAVVRDGNVETWIGPDGRTHSRVVPQ
ncbi:hypothetical protein [Falsiroseomonas sp.]|uniref:hypothetical protein n=1 Tax=Falsiroseomonas sp. TaxID=2870721 RepID=UPI003564B458